MAPSLTSRRKFPAGPLVCTADGGALPSWVLTTFVFGGSNVSVRSAREKRGTTIATQATATTNDALHTLGNSLVLIVCLRVEKVNTL